jgi:hypothetical protein
LNRFNGQQFAAKPPLSQAAFFPLAPGKPPNENLILGAEWLPHRFLRLPVRTVSVMRIAAIFSRNAQLPSVV